MKYTILSAPYTAHLQTKLTSVKPSSRDWWNSKNELDNLDAYRYEWELISEHDGLATIANDLGHSMTLPRKCITPLIPLPSIPSPPYCLLPYPPCCILPHPIGAIVDVLFVRMQITDRKPLKQRDILTWQYKCSPVNSHERYWGDESGWHPHAFLLRI